MDTVHDIRHDGNSISVVVVAVVVVVIVVEEERELTLRYKCQRTHNHDTKLLACNHKTKYRNMAVSNAKDPKLGTSML